MRGKEKILKDIDAQISNLRYAMTDNDLDKDFPLDMKQSLVNGYKRRIKELEEIRKRLEDLLM
jgi:hypothetical protein